MSIMDELELLWRRARKVAFALPLLLLVGFSTGRVMGRALDVEDGAPVRVSAAADIPRVHFEALSRKMEQLRGVGESTAETVSIYREHVEPVELVLRRRGLSRETAREVAWPVVELSYGKRLDIATVLSIILVESNGRPNATSSVGARGLMQVMPLWAGYWRNCGRDLYSIEGNLCHGTSILAWYLKRNGGDTRRALLGYNGCVRGTNTPNCHTYPDKVERIRRQIHRELEAQRARFPIREVAAD
jgi:hypothetical protein